MKQKKSLTAAIEEAQQLSTKNPNMTYWVMDKPRKNAICTCIPWIYRERILEGYTTHSKYQGGHEV